MISVIGVFVLCAVVITGAGWVLVGAAEVIAERTKLGRAFLGMILLATITSLPELSTGISAVAVVGSPDIAVGDVVGSCVFNLLLFALADAVSPRVAFYGKLSHTHNLTASFGVILIGLLVLAILAPETACLSVGHVGIYSVLLAALYLGAARLLYAVNLRAVPASEEPGTQPRISLLAAVIRCVGAAAAVTIAGSLLAVSADRITTESGLSASFVGAQFVAAATSLPEVVTTLAAVRLRAFDLAAGNLLGSNLFNMVILVVDDIAYLDGPLLASTSDTLATPAIIAIVMTAVIMSAINFVKRIKPHPVDAGAGVSLAVLYLLNAWLLYDASA
jgi:cation:H+ antiporter